MAPTTEDEARSPNAAADEDDDDDYMNMVIEEPSKKETPLQRMQREKREVSRHLRLPYVLVASLTLTLSKEDRAKSDAEDQA